MRVTSCLILTTGYCAVTLGIITAHAAVIIPCYPPCVVIPYILRASCLATNAFAVRTAYVAFLVGRLDNVSEFGLPFATAAARFGRERKLR